MPAVCPDMYLKETGAIETSNSATLPRRAAACEDGNSRELDFNIVLKRQQITEGRTPTDPDAALRHVHVLLLAGRGRGRLLQRGGAEQPRAEVALLDAAV